MKIEPSSVCVIVLAHGARTEGLNKVLNGVFAQKTGYVIVIANAVTSETMQLLDKMQNIHLTRLEIVKSDENLGSAGGYALGLSTAIKKPYNYFWLLDDDNLPQQGALTALLNAFSFYEQTLKKNYLALQSLRESLPEMIDTINKKSKPPLPKPASFIGFHIFNIWEVCRTLLPIKNHKSTADLNNKKEIIRLYLGPYGGLFFHRDAIDTLGFPDPRFFLYADDIAYTLNFTSKGGNLLMVPESRITDIEPVWNTTGGKTSNIYRRLKVLSPQKTYYEVRNRVYLGRKMFPGHQLMYLLNKWLYIFFLGLYAIYYRCGNRYKLILRAVRDGERGFLGKRNFED